MLFFRGWSRGEYSLEDAPSGVVASPGFIEASLRKSGSSRSMWGCSRGVYSLEDAPSGVVASPGFIEAVEDEEGCVGAMGD